MAYLGSLSELSFYKTTFLNQQYERLKDKIEGGLEV